MNGDIITDLFLADDPRAAAVNLAALWETARALHPARMAVAPSVVLELRYAPDGTRRQTFAQIGAALGVTPQRARELVARALKLLRVRWRGFAPVPASLPIADAAQTPADAPTLREAIAARVADLRAAHPDARIVIETARRNWPRAECPGVAFVEGLPWAYVVTVEDAARDAG